METKFTLYTVSTAVVDKTAAEIPDLAFIDPEVNKAFRAAVEGEADAWKSARLTAIESAAELAPAVETSAIGARDAHRAYIEMLAEKLGQPRGGWAGVIVMAVCLMVCIGSEFALNKGVLPFLVAGASTGVLMLALSLGPALIPVSADRLILCIFGNGSWSPFVGQSRSRKVLLGSVALIDVAAIVMVGACRGAVAIMKDSNGVETPGQVWLVHCALILLGVAIAITGAMLSLWIGVECREMREHRDLEAQLGAAEEGYPALVAAADEAAENAARARSHAAHSEQIVAEFRTNFVAERYLKAAARKASIIANSESADVMRWREIKEVFERYNPQMPV